MSVFDILQRYRSQFLEGLSVTVKLSLLIWTIGLLVGLLVGVAGSRWRLAVGVPSRVVSFVLGGVPVLVFLFWLHYPMQAMLQIVIDPFVTATAALGTLNTFLVADVIRNTLNDFPQQYLAAARVCGLTPRETVTKIQLPIIFRQVLPSILFIQVSMLQTTLFASLISVDELFRIAQRINSEVYRPVEIYTALAVFFLSVCLPLNGLGFWLKARFTRDTSER